MKLVLLPGLHGTGDLFAELEAETASGWSTQVVAYPRHLKLDYGGCADFVRDRLPENEEFILLGESFSGPVAITLAAAEPPALRGLVLCNSFALRPVPFSHGFFPWSLAFSLPLPRAVARKLGADAGAASLEPRMRTAIASVRPGVLAHRFRQLLTVDVTDALRSVRVPILYLRGSGDAVVGRKSLAHIQSVRPDLQVAEIAAGHLLLQVRPSEAWEAIGAFASEHCGVR